MIFSGFTRHSLYNRKQCRYIVVESMNILQFINILYIIRGAECLHKSLI